MILTIFWENPAVVGIIIAIPSAILGYFGYRRSRGVDEATKQVGEMAGHIGLITALQEDNKVLRGELVALRQGVELVQARLGVVETGKRELEREIALLHSENEALKVENQKLKDRISELEKANGP